jgi:hypothetical protein
MDDIDKRILAFASSVPNEADRKRAVFERLKTESPDVAEWISQMSQAFGRPLAIVIKFRSGELFRSGKFRAAQDYPDFGKQCARKG